MTEASLEPAGKAALSGRAAASAFAAAGAVLSAGDRGVAILNADGQLAYAASEAQAMFSVANPADLGAVLAQGQSPTARRLRQMAMALPIGAPARLERLSFARGRKPIVMNLRCARVLGANGEALLALFAPAPALPAASSPTVPEPPLAPTAPKGEGKTRFLWALDEAGRFGAEGGALRSALGANAPRSGERLENLQERAGASRAEGWVSAIGRRETFSDLLLTWPAERAGFQVRMRLSGAPLFGRAREFQGFRGFGVIEGEPYPDEMPQIAAGPEEPLQPYIPIEGVARETENLDAPAFADVTALTGDMDERAVSEQPTGIEAERSNSDAELSESAGSDPVGLDPEIASDEPAAAASDAPASGGEAQPVATPPQERTAAIYILRQTGSGPSRVTPIRPNPPDTPAPSEPAPDSESVALSKSERDAFREIARALVGRTPASRADRFPPGDVPPAPGATAAPDDIPAPTLRDGPAPEGDAGNNASGRNAAAILDKIPVGVLVAREARAIYLNQTLLTLLGYDDLEQFEASDGLSAMFGGENPESLQPQGAHVLAIVRADGQSVAVDGHAQAILWDGAPATLIAFRRAAEEARPATALETGERPARNGSADELQVMLDLAIDGAATLDSAGRILTLNASGERLFGYARSDVAGESVLMLLAPQSHPETTARLENLSGSEEFAPAHPLIVTGRRRDGTAVTLALTLARLGSGDARHYCALVRNLGPEREAERRLGAARDAALAASSSKTDFLAQVSHEIRTPLHAILGFAEVMLEERFGPIGNERYKDYLKDIHTSGRHVVSLADDLLDLARIEAGKLELAFTQVDANAVIRECVSLMQPEAARERIIMRVSLADHMPWVMVDERSLRQIMLNLMSNAVKFNEPGGQVIVSTAVDEGGQAVIRVRDTGVGMSESEIGHALEPFGQIGRGTKSGAGLGLPLTKALVEANRAEFSIKSQRERGTLIEIAFPVARAAQ